MAGRKNREGHRFTYLHLPSAHLERLQRQPAGLHDRRVKAKYLLDRIGHELRMAAELRKLIWISEQRQDAITDQVRRGQVAGDEQQVAMTISRWVSRSSASSAETSALIRSVARRVRRSSIARAK